MTGLALIAVLVGAIWTLVLLQRLPLVYGALATVVVGACLGYAFFSLDLGGTHWTLDRLALLLLLATYLVRRRQGLTETRPIGASEWIALAFLGWITASLLLHDFRLAYGRTATPTWRWLTAYLIPVLLYWIARESPSGERRANGVHAAIVAFGIYLAFTGICEVMRVWELVFPKYIADPGLGIHFGRARGPMLTSVSYGLFLGTSLICLLASWGRVSRGARLIVPAAAVLFMAGLYFSYTRSVWMGTGLGTLIVLALSLGGRARVLIVGGLASLAAVMGATKIDKIVAFEREQSASTVQDSAECRVSFAYVSWKMFEDRPLWGFGFGQFPRAKLPYLEDRVDLPLDRIRPLVHHNTLLSLLVETGAVGLLLFLAVLAAWSASAWSLARGPDAPPWARRQGVLFLGLMGLYVCQLAFHELSYSTIDNCLVFFLAGMTRGATPPWDAAAAEPAAVRAAGRLSPAFYVKRNLTTD